MQSHFTAALRFGTDAGLGDWSAFKAGKVVFRSRRPFPIVWLDPALKRRAKFGDAARRRGYQKRNRTNQVFFGINGSLSITPVSPDPSSDQKPLNVRTSSSTVRRGRRRISPSAGSGRILYRGSASRVNDMFSSYFPCSSIIGPRI